MNLKNILWVRNTGDIVPSAPIADNLFGMKLSGGDVITTATGNPVSIVTNKAQNAISTILSYSPKQSGTGDPSPQNIRPIEGWTEANLFGCGKNLFTSDGASENKYLTSDGNELGEINWNVSDYLKVQSNTQYHFNPNSTEGYVAKHVYYDSIKTFIGYINSGERTFITPSNCVYMRFSYRKISTNVQLELGSTATAYEPYTQGANNTISLGGTYYGFSIDVERGVLRNEWGYIAEYDGEELSGRWISDRDVYSPNTSPTIGAEVAYELATPLELPLTPQTVALLSGANTIWCDGDEVSVTYKAKKA